MKGSPAPRVGFEPTKLGLMEHDPLDCNRTANVFLLLFSLIYHPLQSQQVHLTGRVSFAVHQWKSSVEGSMSHGLPAGVTALALALLYPPIAAFYNLAIVIFNFLLLYRTHT